MQIILNNYESLQETMEIVSHGSDDYSRHASGILALMEKFKNYSGLELAVFIFSIPENLSITLQGVIPMLMIVLQLLMQVLKLSLSIEQMNILLGSLNKFNWQQRISVIPQYYPDKDAFQDDK